MISEVKEKELQKRHGVKDIFNSMQLQLIENSFKLFGNYQMMKSELDIYSFNSNDYFSGTGGALTIDDQIFQHILGKRFG